MLLARWKKYTSKQKTIIVSVASIVILAFAILGFLSSRTQYEKLVVTKTPQDASTIAKLLEDEGIDYKLGSDSVTISVDKKRLQDASVLVNSSNVPSDGLTMEALLNNDLSTTNSDRNLKNNLYYQNEMEKYLMKMPGITDAQVSYIPNDDNYDILSEKEDYPASVALTVTPEFEASAAEGIAEYVAGVIGNETTEKIKIIDQNGNLLFGGQDDLYSGNANSILEYSNKLQNTYKNNLYILMLKLGYTDVQAMFNLELNNDKVSELYTERIPADGNDQGLLSRSYKYEAENTSGTGGTPGTDSNDETTYEVEDSSTGDSTVTTEENEYLPNERVTNTEFEVGAVNKEESSVSIVCTKAVTYKEEDLRNQGLLDDMSYDEYVAANSDRTELDVGEEVITLVSNATGIAAERIEILAYEQPIYIPESSNINWNLIISIFLVVLIVALLLFVIFRATSPVEVTELEPELSVEQLLATTKENQPLDDIEFAEKSESKKMIEKFVDEKPEAVANLLRNWLSDDYN